MNIDTEKVNQAKQSFNHVLDNQKYANIIKDGRAVIDTFMQVKKDGHIRFYSLDELDKLFMNYGFKKENQAITNMKFPFAKQSEYTDIYHEITNRDRLLYDITNENGVVWVNHINVGNTVFTKM